MKIDKERKRRSLKKKLREREIIKSEKAKRIIK